MAIVLILIGILVVSNRSWLEYIRKVVPFIQLLMITQPYGWVGLAILQGIKEVPGGNSNPYSFFISIFGIGCSFTFITLGITQGVNPISNSSSLLLWISIIASPVLWVMFFIKQDKTYTLIGNKIISSIFSSLIVGLGSCLILGASFYIGTNFLPPNLSPLMIVIPLGLLFNSSNSTTIDTIQDTDDNTSSNDLEFFILGGLISGLLIFIPNRLILEIISKYKSINNQDKVIFYSTTDSIQFFVFWCLGISRGDMDSFFRFNTQWESNWMINLSILIIYLTFRTFLYFSFASIDNSRSISMYNSITSTSFTLLGVTLIDLFILVISITIHPLFFLLTLFICLIRKSNMVKENPLPSIMGLSIVPIFILFI